MSAFLCCENHFQFIADQLCSLSAEKYQQLYYKLFNSTNYYEQETEEVIVNLVNDWKELNYYALNQRYEDAIPDKKTIRTIKRAELKYNKPLQLIKALECLLYQCTEGDAVNQLSYELLNKTIDFLVYGYIHALPAWRGTKWEVRERQEEKLISITDMMKRK